MAVPRYPFEPKSNKFLVPGQFWGVPLSNGQWACGRVLGINSKPDQNFPGSSRTFLAGLMGWEGDQQPTSDGIAGTRVVAQGWANILTIRETGRLILGHRDLALDNIGGLLEVSHRGGGTVMLYEGALAVRPATREEASTLPVIATWGFNTIAVLAERLFVKRLPLNHDGA
jgi:hypothetical protein